MLAGLVGDLLPDVLAGWEVVVGVDGVRVNGRLW